MRRKILCVSFAVAMTISFFCVYAKESVKYVKTSDGDTARFIIEGENVRVRFLGINTPEVAGEDKVEEPYGKEAMEYTTKRLEKAKKIEIEYDDNADKEDRFGRILAYVWVDDVLLQEDLVRNGYARTYMMKKNYQYADRLKAAEEEAKKEKLGIWNEEIVNQKMTENGEATSTEDDYNSDERRENVMHLNKSGHIVIIVILILFTMLVGYFSKDSEK